ncbi:MAG: Re/Si-specific NAD(P)(+) transhydrogenase subunit alpha [Planctomycetota bacterium]
MRIVVPTETGSAETRVALSPDIVSRYLKKEGMELAVEAGLGRHCHWSDDLYREAGCKVVGDRAELLAGADLVLRVGKPPSDEVGLLPEGSVHVSFLDPFGERDLVEALRERGVTAVSMEMMPRSTRAQKMDALSSQHSIAGYYMVLLAAAELGKLLPMMMTPAGTIQPARVFVIGAGVAGLQAIATAKRLGARIEAFDTRPVVKEQVESLGGRFVEIDLGETGQTDQGYAKELTEEQKRKQLEGMKRHCAQADVVITTAQLFGRKAPVVVTREMVAAMRPGAVVVDYAVESGGNVEGSAPGETVEVGGVRIIGLRNYAGRMALDASRMYASNLYNMIDEFWDPETKGLRLDLEDEILAAAVVTHGKELVSPMIRKAYGLEEVAS